MSTRIYALAIITLILSLSCLAFAEDNELKSFGSGFLVDARGYVLTNEHVVHRAKTVQIVLAEKEKLPATVLAADEDHDLALLKVETDKPLPSVHIGTSAEVKRQQAVLAIGFPFGEKSVTSTSGRIVSLRQEGSDQVLVVDAVVNPGNSGGPLLNDRGEAIGVVTSLLLANVGGTRVKAGEIYATPISFAMPLLAAIPGFDWTSVGRAKDRLEMDALDAAAAPAVVQIMSDRVEPGTIEGASGGETSSFGENALSLIRSYMDRMDLKYEVDTSGDWPVLNCPVKMDNATHQLHIVIDTKTQLVYLFLNRYLVAPQNSRTLPRVLRTLMERNWDLNIGKFEWDKSDGEVRLSYTFTTENGVGFEAFEAIVLTLVGTGDRLYPDLKKVVDGKPANE
ncbi:trypsin-like peptidase domain-containing protein [bacterium]|nr:trypsin-like peptidase domain-containing protein [bacterium]